MKNLFFVMFLLFGAHNILAQDKNWSIDINYPFSINDAFGSSNQGTVGAGLKYRFKNLGKFNFGVSLDGTWFSTTIVNDSDPVQEFDYRNFFFQPRVFTELPITKNKRLQLTAGLGWTWSRSVDRPAFFDEFGNIQGGPDLYNGLNLNLGITYDVSSRFFVQAQYDQIFLSGDTSDRNVNLIKLGTGFRF